MEMIGTNNTTLTKDEIIIELLNMLKENKMNEHASGVYEVCVYVDNLEKKLYSMEEELILMRKQIEEMKEDTVLNNLKKTVSEATDRLENRCNIIKEELGVVKNNILKKATELVSEAKRKGRAALNKLSERVQIERMDKRFDGIMEHEHNEHDFYNVIP